MTPTQSSRQHAANVLGALSLVVADRMNSAVEAVTRLGPSAPAALAALHEFLDGGSVTQLSSVLGLTHSGTVRLVDRLAVEGLVERGRAQDGRAVSVVLTRTGHRTAARILQARQESLARALSGLSADDVETLAAALDAMLTTVTLTRVEERSARTNERSQPWLCRLCDFAACGRDEGDCPVNNVVTNSTGT
ncbi:DNA-binding transcriptional regulator, MarR family [Actinopolymorpha cephalotaxi]|uniref:DNA-binding MarR family transcriptional regulator n=1 Tax=Actinopolymorpha cephalotaxi TaxID=504797 RepID=A0A1I2RFK1_9ACTN|nr:MarR family transcriptional regulator [Actinopolymorpha cephalotaxi]NYH82274.1 DNA-binding MarR family transcriptional regulator [Actinopolymorpha cephalotaxi]SFG38279.1 DNA-binding transcriptional regulator, MarR family [Actinopolymorpha cephalotaxi]